MGRKAEPSEKNIYYRSREKIKGLSRERAAEKIGISSTTLGRIELGHIAPSPMTLLLWWSFTVSLRFIIITAPTTAR